MAKCRNGTGTGHVAKLAARQPESPHVQACNPSSCSLVPDWPTQQNFCLYPSPPTRNTILGHITTLHCLRVHCRLGVRVWNIILDPFITAFCLCFNCLMSHAHKGTLQEGCTPRVTTWKWEPRLIILFAPSAHPGFTQVSTYSHEAKVSCHLPGISEKSGLRSRPPASFLPPAVLA